MAEVEHSPNADRRQQERRAGVDRRADSYERRGGERYKLNRAVTVEVGDVRVSGLCADISAGGMRVETTAAVATDAAVTLTLAGDDASAPAVDITARVVWSQSLDAHRHLIGCQLKTLACTDRLELQALVSLLVGDREAKTALSAARLSGGKVVLKAIDLCKKARGQRQRRRRRLLGGMGVGLLVTALGAAGTALGLFDSYELKTLDLRYKLGGGRPLHPDIRLVVVDDATIDHFGWPLPRGVHAQLLALLTEAGTRAVAYDIVFGDPDRSGPSADAVFANVAERHPCVVFPSVVELQGDDDAAPLAAYRPTALLPPLSAPEALRGRRGTAPIPGLAGASRLAAHIQLASDVDGAVRSLPAWIAMQDHAVPSLAVATYLCGMTKSQAPARLQLLGDGRLRLDGSPDAVRDVPIDGRGIAHVLFPARAAGLTTVSLLDLLGRHKAALAQGDRATALAAYRDTVVLVGQTAASFGDHGPTPLGRSSQLLLVHASFLSNLMHGEFLVAPDKWVNVGLLILLGLAVTMLLCMKRGWHGSAFAAVLALGYVGLGIALFVGAAVWIELFAPLVTSLVALATIGAYNARYRDIEERILRDAFSRFVAPGVLHRILNDPNHLDVGGHLRRITVLFSDIKGYTELSNTRSSRQVIAILREYLDCMSRIILQHEGTIDKIMGDGIMCFFGDPVPCRDHAQRAARTALQMQGAMPKLWQSWSEHGLPPLQIRIGVATGLVHVGNVGSATHIEYTAIGPAVNLAARLEATATPGEVLICTETAERIDAEFVCEQASIVQLKGYETGYQPYRLLSERS